MANYLTLVEQLSEAVDQLNQVLQGDENTTVTINGQQQPSVQKKTLDEVNAKIQLVLDAAADIDAVKYATTADGIASGAEYFSVVSDNEESYLDLYKNTSGNAVFQKSYPSIEGVIPKQVVEEYNSNKSVSGKAVYDFFEENIASSAVDVSLLTGDYNLSLTSAIEAVPSIYRKSNITIEFNDTEQYKFYGVYNEANFTDISKWLKPFDTLAAGDLNLANIGMLYKGFCFQGSQNPVYHPDNSVLIIPLYRFYEDSVLQRTVISTRLDIRLGSGLLSSNLSGVATYSNNTSGINSFLPTNAEFAYINISYNDGDSTFGLSQQKSVADTLRYPKYGFESWTTPELNQKKRLIADNKKYPVVVSRDFDGNDVVQTPVSYFMNESVEFDGFHLYELITNMSITTGFSSNSINKLTGALRVVYVSFINTYSSGASSNATIKFKIQSVEDDTLFREYQAFPTEPYNIETGLMEYSVNMGGFEMSFTFNRGLAGTGYIATGFDANNAKINPTWIASELTRSKLDTSDYLYNYEVCNQELISNYSYTSPENLLPLVQVVNGVKGYLTEGDGTFHSQNCLVSDKKTDIYGIKTLHIDVDTDTSGSFPPVDYSVMKATTSDDSFLGFSADTDSDGQWIHPDIGYSDSDIAGYKYWMVHSVYPFSYPGTEDAEIFVSNNGINWVRIQHPDEIQTNETPLNIPVSYWNVSDGRERQFMPIPDIGSSMLFFDSTSEASRTVTNALNHDPAIICDNGYVNIYITYNLGFDGGAQLHKYRVCYRTNDFVNWEIMREDGTAMPYNSSNAQLIFTKSNGVRNHIQYYYDGTTVGGNEVSPQIVKVSDNEYYLYSVESEYTPISGNKFGIVRYAGSSPYDFDFTSREGLTLDVSPSGRVWHVCARYYNGKFYIMYDGQMATSSDGVNFTNPAYPFFWRGASADLYKPAFIVGHNGVKFAQSLQVRMASPSITAKRGEAMEYWNVRNHTLICEYTSLADIEARGAAQVDDAYVDIQLTFTNERNNKHRTMIIPAVRSGTSVYNIEMLRGDRINAKAFCNTRFNGVVTFRGILIDER